MRIRYLAFAGIVLFNTTFTQGHAETAGGKNNRARDIPAIKKDCTICHVSADVKKGSALLKKSVAELCIECHNERKRPNEHAVDIVPSLPIKGLPLTDGKMTCITCHDPHQNPYGKLLRIPEQDLCVLCHRR